MNRSITILNGIKVSEVVISREDREIVVVVKNGSISGSIGLTKEAASKVGNEIMQLLQDMDKCSQCDNELDEVSVDMGICYDCYNKDKNDLRDSQNHPDAKGVI